MKKKIYNQIKIEMEIIQQTLNIKNYKIYR